MISLALLAAATLDAAVIAQTSATLNALGPHPLGSPRNQAAAQFVAAKLKEAGLSQTVVEEFVTDGSPGSNVVARIPGRSDRLLILATHHDSRRDVQDVTDRSRSLSLLIEMGRRAAKSLPAKTWILASFDGGESKGEGLAHFLEALGRSRDLVDGVILIEAASLGVASGTPSVIVPACPRGDGSSRGLAGRDMVAAALGGIPVATEFSFDDPGISLLTQPFIRTFRTSCAGNAAAAVAAGLGVVQASETPYSRGFIRRAERDIKASDVPARDEAAVRLGEVAYAAALGVDSAAPTFRQSDSWLVVGRSVWPGWLVFFIGLATLAPGLLALRADRSRLTFRAAHAILFIILLYLEPEVSLFAGLLPNLLPPSLSGKLLGPALLPLFLLAASGALGFARGHVNGSWLSIWVWLGFTAAFVLLYLSMGRGKKPPAKARKGKR